MNRVQAEQDKVADAVGEAAIALYVLAERLESTPVVPSATNRRHNVEPLSCVTFANVALGHVLTEVTSRVLSSERIDLHLGRALFFLDQFCVLYQMDLPAEIERLQARAKIVDELPPDLTPP